MNQSTNTAAVLTGWVSRGLLDSSGGVVHLLVNYGGLLGVVRQAVGWQIFNWVDLHSPGLALIIGKKDLGALLEKSSLFVVHTVRPKKLNTEKG